MNKFHYPHLKLAAAQIHAALPCTLLRERTFNVDHALLSNRLLDQVVEGHHTTPIEKALKSKVFLRCMNFITILLNYEPHRQNHFQGSLLPPLVSLLPPQSSTIFATHPL